MPHDLARRLKQPPAHGLHLCVLPSASERHAAKPKIQIVGQHTDCEEHGVGLECPARHVFHAEADLQIFDAVFAGVAAFEIPFHCRLRVFVLAIAGDDVITIGRFLLEQVLVARATHDDQPKRFLGLVHAMNCLGDLPVAELFLIACGNNRDRRLHRRVLICTDRKDLAGLLAIIEDRRLISRAVGAHRHDRLALGHVALAGLNKFEVPRRRSRVALAEFVAIPAPP
jgi:hypothetical protein